MSFLNSVLNTIGCENKSDGSLSQTFWNSKPAQAEHSNVVALKRKREDHQSKDSVKHAKNAHQSSVGPHKPGNKASEGTSDSERQSRMISSLGKSANALHNKPSDAAVEKSNAEPQTRDTAKSPKKGSYAEIMARAKASQSKTSGVGTISHKPKDQQALSYKKELKLRKKAALNKKLGIKDEGKNISSPSSRNSSPGRSIRDGKKISQSPRTNDAKFAKPQPTYKGTMKSDPNKSQVSAANIHRSKPSKLRYDEYAATDEDDLEDLEEDEYGSEESDDMEAGFSDVELEENKAAKLARKEDEEEAHLEAKLKREKEERKKKLEALSRKAKPLRY